MLKCFKSLKFLVALADVEKLSVLILTVSILTILTIFLYNNKLLLLWFFYYDAICLSWSVPVVLKPFKNRLFFCFIAGYDIICAVKIWFLVQDLIKVVLHNKSRDVFK